MIRVNNVWKKFGRHEALQGLSFSVPEGSAFALVGANGAGNTDKGLDIDYSLTMLALSTSHAMKALNGDQRMTSVGWCQTRMNYSETDVLPRCLNVGNGPSCATAFLEYTPMGAGIPKSRHAKRTTRPSRKSLTSNSLTRFGTELPFRDPSALTHYPVDGPKLSESQIVLRTYTRPDHFTRRRPIPEVRLNDWEPR